MAKLLQCWVPAIEKQLQKTYATGNSYKEVAWERESDFKFPFTLSDYLVPITPETTPKKNMS